MNNTRYSLTKILCRIAKVDVAIAISLTLGLAGCATYPIVSTHQPLDASTDASGAQSWKDTVALPVNGFSYFLPKQFLQIDVTGTPIKPEEVEKKLQAAENAIKTSKEEIKSLTTKKQELEALIKELQSKSKPFTTQETELNVVTAKLDLQGQNLKKLEASKADLTAQKLISEQGKCVLNFAVKLSQSGITADADLQMVLELDHSETATDDYNIKVNSEGLLTNSTITREDQTGQFLTELAGALAIRAAPSITSDAKAGEQEDKCKSIYKFQTTTEPQNIPKKLGLSPSSTDPSTLEYQLWKLREETEIEITLKSGDHFATPPANEWKDLRNESVNQTQAICNGIFYRRNLPYLFQISKKSQQDTESWPIAASLFSFPTGPVSCLPFEASRFVTSTHEVTLVNGVLTEWDVNRPSEGLAVVKLPVEIAKAILSIPAELIQLKVNYNSESTNLLKAQQAEIEALETLLQVREAIEQGTYLPPEPDE